MLNSNDIYKTALKVEGIEKQALILAERSLKLINTVIKRKHNICTMDTLLEDLADVHIAAKTFLMYNGLRERFEKVKARKVLALAAQLSMKG